MNKLSKDKIIETSLKVQNFFSHLTFTLSKKCRNDKEKHDKNFRSGAYSWKLH